MLDTLSEEGWRWICRSAVRGELQEESTEKEKKERWRKRISLNLCTLLLTGRQTNQQTAVKREHLEQAEELLEHRIKPLFGVSGVLATPLMAA